MPKFLLTLFASLKFYYYHYNIILLNSTRLYENNFFKNSLLINKSLNINFFFKNYLSLNDKQSWYYIGINSFFFTFKTLDYFFNHIKFNFEFNSSSSIFNKFMGSNSLEKNSKNLWKYKYVNVLLNFFDWSFFFKNNFKKSKMLFLFANTHPIQNMSFKYLKKYDFDDYNLNELNFNVSISNNNLINYNKSFLLSEFFFYNNVQEYTSYINNNFFLFFFIKSQPCSSLFNFNKNLFKFSALFNFYFLVHFPYYYDDSYFIFNKVSDNRCISTLFFDKSLEPISKSIFLNLFNFLLQKNIFLKKKSILIKYYKFFFILLSLS